MRLSTTLAASAIASLLLSTSASFAVIKGPIIDIPHDNTPVDLPPHDNTPVDVPPNGPIDPPDNVNDALIDAILGDDSDGDQQVADSKLILSCVVSGDDLIITNKGVAIPAGAKVKWAANGDHGTVKLPDGLRAGQKARIENVLDGGADKCTAEVVL